MNANDSISSREPAQRNLFLVLLFVATLLVAAFVFVVPPLIVARLGLESSAGNMVASHVALLGILVTGIFVFMTFRIDSGARSEAREEARREAREVAVDIAQRTAKTALKDKVEAEVGTLVEANLPKLVDEKSRKLLPAHVKRAERKLEKELGKNFNEHKKELEKDFSGLEKKLRERVKRDVPAVVEERLPGVVKPLLPGEVGALLPGELSSQLPPALSSVLPPMVEERLPGMVKPLLPGEVGALLPGELDSQLRSALSSALSREVEERLPRVARPLAEAQLRRIVEDQRKEGLYRQIFDEVRVAIQKDVDRLFDQMNEKVARVIEERLSAAIAAELERRRPRFWPRFGRGGDE